MAPPKVLADQAAAIVARTSQLRSRSSPDGFRCAKFAESLPLGEPDGALGFKPITVGALLHPSYPYPIPPT
jgi:hypothetical protein